MELKFAMFSCHPSLARVFKFLTLISFLPLRRTHAQPKALYVEQAMAASASATGPRPSGVDLQGDQPDCSIGSLDPAALLFTSRLLFKG